MKSRDLELKSVCVSDDIKMMDVGQSFQEYYAQRSQFALEDKIVLPPWKDLSKFGKLHKLKIALSDSVTTYEFANGFWFQVKQYRGYITDLGSVPKIGQLFVNDDDNRINKLYWDHDLAYSTHYIPRCLADKILADGAKSLGYPKASAGVMHAALRVGGRRPWVKNLSRGQWASKTSEVMFPAEKNVIDGGIYMNRLKQPFCSSDK